MLKSLEVFNVTNKCTSMQCITGTVLVLHVYSKANVPYSEI